MQIKINQLNLDDGLHSLSIPEWQIDDGQSWGVFSTDGDIGSMLGDLLCGEYKVAEEICWLSHPNIAQVSLAEQQRLWKKS